MIDVNLTRRDLYGNVTFGLPMNTSLTGIDMLIQKVTMVILSNSKTTYFGEVLGCNLNLATLYNFDSSNVSDYKIEIGSNLVSIKKQIQADDLMNNIPFENRLKNLELKDIVYDKKLSSISLSLLVSSNSASKTINLPILK